MDQNVKKYKFYCLDAQHCTFRGAELAKVVTRDLVLPPLCFPRARSKFGTDSPFHSGDIAAFVPGGRLLEI